jgi:methyl-accepting chemotaxis protein
MKMRTRILSGFIVVIALMLVVGGLALLQFSEASKGFTEYRNLARDTNLEGRLQANMLMVRISAKNFIVNGTEEEKQQYEDYLQKMHEFLEESQSEIKAPERAALIDEIEKEVETYEAGFDQVVSYKAQRNDHVLNYLNLQGAAMENNLTNILISAREDGDDTASYHSAITMRHLLLARLYVVKFLDTNAQAEADRVYAEMAGMETNLEILDEELENAERRGYLAAIREVKSDYIEHFDALISVIENRNDIITNTLDVVGPKIAGQVEEVKLSIKADQDALGPVLQAANQQATTLILIILAVATAAGLVMSFLTFRSIARPMGTLAGLSAEISTGNFDVSIDKGLTKNNDEIAALSNSFGSMIDSLQYKSTMIGKVANGDMTVDIDLASDKDALGMSLKKMTASLNETLSQVDEAVDQVNTGSDQVSQSSQSLSQGATEQASSLEEISSSINEINSQAKQSAENADEANNLAHQASQNAEKGNQEMGRLKTAMATISESSDQIKKVVKVIDDIAFQINLLALNANVEAARAGKYGKGFAVVADEVRNLAVRSGDAVKETTVMVEESLKSIEMGNEASESTATQLAAIVEDSQKVAEFLAEISAASKEQAQGIEQITEGLDQIDQVTQSNTASAEESASASEELAAQAQQLKGLISQFTLNRSHSSRFVRIDEDEKPRKTDAPKRRPQELLAEKPSAEETVSPEEVIVLDDDDFGEF